MAKRVNRKRDHKIFSRTAGRVNKMNLPRMQRGGTRL